MLSVHWHYLIIALITYRNNFLKSATHPVHNGGYNFVGKLLYHFYAGLI